MRLKICALAMLAFGVSSLAHAEAAYTASFSLAGDGLRTLSSGSSAQDDPNTVYPGSWISGTTRIGSLLNTQDFLGYVTDPVSGAESKTWGNPRHAEGIHTSTGPSFTMGETIANVYSGFSSTYGQGSVAYSSLRTTINMQGNGGQGSGVTTWERQFSLNAHSSFTFAGLATVGITDPLSAPLDASTTFSSGQTFASLSLADAADRVRTSISASLFGFSGLFSYATDPSGLLSLTITNNLDTAISGTLKAGSYVNALSLPGSASLSVASPVPEPSTYLTMLLGLGIVGAVARKKLQGQASLAPSLAGC